MALRKVLRPTSATPNSINVEPPSGAAAPEAAEIEKRAGEPADGSCVVKLQLADVAVKPWPVMVPVPLTVTVPAPWLKMADAIKLNVQPSTVQKLATGP